MATGKPVRTIRLRRLASILREKRLAAGLSPEQAAARADVSRAWVYRAENAEARPQPNNVKAVLLACGVTDPEEIRQVVTLAKDAARPNWWESYALTRELAGLIALEAEACEKRVWEPSLVPGLLQVPGYAREVITSGPDYLDPERVEQLVRVRLERQKALWRENPLRVVAVIDEAVLRRVIGSEDVMREQLAHLAGMAEHPHVVVRVLRDRAGAHPGMTGPFTILRFPAEVDGDIVYCEGPAGAVYAEKPAELERSRRAFSQLSALALPPGETLDLLRETARD